MTLDAAAAGTELDAKLAALDAWLKAEGAVVVCYSGGVDSAFVLAAATRALGAGAIGLTAVSPSLAPAELDDAKRVAAELGADHRVVSSHEIDDPGYQANGPDRCFFCKSELYRIAHAKSAEWGVRCIVNGTNTDDLGDYRPGLKAASDAGVRSPLVELGFSKVDVREGAKRYGLGVWNKPAAACLSSRIPFGTRVTPERLAQIGAFEAELYALGFRGHRVRLHPTGEGEGAKSFARIELANAEDLVRAASGDVRDALVQRGRELGFLYVTLDLAGYRMGSHNEALERPRRSLPVLTSEG